MSFSAAAFIWNLFFPLDIFFVFLFYSIWFLYLSWFLAALYIKCSIKETKNFFVKNQINNPQRNKETVCFDCQAFKFGKTHSSLEARIGAEGTLPESFTLFS